MKLDTNRNLFVSKKNYYIILIFDKIIKLLWWISIRSGLWKANRGQKNRVLFIGPTHIGDILLSTPAIRFAKEKNPALKIICIASSSSKAAIENNFYIVGIEIIDLPWFLEEKGDFIRTIRSFFQFIRVLKGANAETAVNFSSTSYHREHLAMWLAGIPNRVGFSHKGFGYFLTGNITFVEDELIARQKLRMAGYCLGEQTDNYSLKPDYFIPRTSEKKAQELLSSLGLKCGRAIVGINIGARHNYLWPESHWVKLCNSIFKIWGANIVFLGTKNFELFIDKVKSQLNFQSFSLVGMTSLDELAALLKRLDLLITIDTGTRHIANAVGTKSIVLRHGADSIFEFGRYVETECVIAHPVSCSPCGREMCPLETFECITGIEPQFVICTIKKIWHNKSILERECDR